RIRFHQPFADDNCVFEVVPAPRHECDQYILSECEFAVIGARAIRKDVAGFYTLSCVYGRLLVDARILVRSFELCYFIYIRTGITHESGAVLIAINANDDAFGIERIDHSIALATDDASGILRGNSFHTGSNNWR